MIHPVFIPDDRGNRFDPISDPADEFPDLFLRPPFFLLLNRPAVSGGENQDGCSYFQNRMTLTPTRAVFTLFFVERYPDPSGTWIVVTPLGLFPFGAGKNLGSVF